MKLRFLKNLKKKYEHSAIRGMDIAVILVIFMLGSVMLIYNLVTLSGVESSHKVVVITKNLKEVERFDLNQDRMVEIEGYGVLSIKSGRARVLHANCRDQICVHTNDITHEGEAIICLPNKIIIEIRCEE